VGGQAEENHHTFLFCIHDSTSSDLDCSRYSFNLEKKDHFLTARKYTILGVPITDVHVRAQVAGSSMSEHFGLRSAEPKVRCILALLLRSDHDIRQNVLTFPISRR
jgi:hypothetical protein